MWSEWRLLPLLAFLGLIWESAVFDFFGEVVVVVFIRVDVDMTSDEDEIKQKKSTNNLTGLFYPAS